MTVRALGVAAGWLVAVTVATGIGWIGVGQVADQVSPAGPSALSQAEVQRRITAAGSPGDVAPTTAPPGTAAGTAAGPDAQRSVTAVGGTAVLTCSGDRLQARWSPAQGFALQDAPGAGASRIELEFSDGRHASKITARCTRGHLSVQVDEGTAEAEH